MRNAGNVKMSSREKIKVNRKQVTKFLVSTHDNSTLKIL